MLLPNVGLRVASGDSGFTYFADIARVFASVSGGGCWMTMVLPEDAAGTAAPLPHTDIVAEPGRADFARQAKALDWRVVEAYERSLGTRIADAVVTSRQRTPLQLAALSDERRGRWGVLPVYLIEPLVQFYDDHVTEASQALAYALSTPVFWSEHERDLALSLVRRWLAPALVDEVLRRSFLIRPAPPFEALEPLAAARRDRQREKFTLFYGARFSPYKRVPNVAEAFDYIFAAGHAVDVVMTTPTGKLKTYRYFDRRRYPYVDLRCGVGRDEYLGIAATCHAFVVMSSSESALPAGFLEQLYLGLGGVLPDSRWAREGVPEWYPYFFRRQPEAIAWLEVMERRWSETGSVWAPGELERLREWMRERYTPERSYGSLWDRIARDRAERGFAATGRALVREACAALASRERERDSGARGVSLEELLREVASHSTAGFAVERRRVQRMPTNYEVYRLALECGWRDAYDGPEPRLVPA